MQVAVRDLTIPANRSTAEFTVSNTGELPLTVTIISDAMTATPEVFSIAGGQDIIVLLAVAGARVSDDVIIEADNGDVAIIDVDVTPLRTETVTKTVVDATVKISARTADSWAFKAPAGAVLNVSVSAGMTSTHG